MACLTDACRKACPLNTDCKMRVRPQSVVCSDPKTRSELEVHFCQAEQGVAFVTDHVVPPGSSLSCDWCVCYCDKQKSHCNGILIELKGSDFRHAVQQLSSTCEAFKNVWPSLSIKKTYAVLSGKRIPSVKSSDYKIVGQVRLPGFSQLRARKRLSVSV